MAIPQAVIRYRRERVVELTRAGHSAREIADILRVTVRSVTRMRQKTGVSQDYVQPYITEELKQKAHDMLVDGASYIEVVRTTGISHRYIRHLFPGMGWSYQDVGRYSQLQRKMGHRVLGA